MLRSRAACGRGVRARSQGAKDPTCRVCRRQHALGDAHVAHRFAVELRLHGQAARGSRSDERRLSAGARVS